MAQVVLVKEQEGLGKMGEAVKVADGYARNYLLPKKLAILATPGNLERIAKLKKEQEVLERKRLEEIKTLCDRMQSVTIMLKVKVGEEEKLFGSVTNVHIQEALKQHGFAVDKRKILLDEPIKKLGEYTVAVKLHPDVNVSLKLQVLKE